MGSLGGQSLLYIDVIYVRQPLPTMGYKGRTHGWKDSFDSDPLLRKNDCVENIKVLCFEGEQRSFLCKCASLQGW